MPEAGEERAPGATSAEQAPGGPSAEQAPAVQAVVAAEQAPAIQAPAVAEQPSAADRDVASASPGPHDQDAAGPRSRWVFYGLGLSLQTLLWFLLFLAITVAVLVGNKLTEFRYVGF